LRLLKSEDLANISDRCFHSVFKIEGPKMTIEELRKMPLHDTKYHELRVSTPVTVSIVRVVGGWIYCFEKESLGAISLSTTFVPDMESK
jgi:hypothetical protein